MFSNAHLELSGKPYYIFLHPQAIVSAVHPDAPTQWSVQMQKNYRLVSKKELKTIYGIPYSFQHIARLEKAGLFPKRIQLGAGRVAWYAHEIEEWIASRPRSGPAAIAA